MPEKTCTSSPSSPRRCSKADRRAARLVCAPELPGVGLCVATDSAASQPRHAHDSLTLGVVTAGVRRIETATGTARIAPGEAFAVPPGEAHACVPESGRCSYLALSVAASSLPPGFPLVLPLRLADAALAGTLLGLAEALESPAGGLERQSLLAEVLERLAEHGAQARPPARPSDPAGLSAAVARARALLEDNLEPGLGLEALAAACGAEPLALHRAFTREFGLPPHAFQTHARLRRAKALLRAGASLSDAALGAGFCDQSHMNRHFARVVGLTPAQYARAHT